MASATAPLEAARPVSHGRAEGTPRALTFDSVYDKYAPFVWRSVCRLGVPSDAADDAVQEIFLVVHRRLPEFEERTSIVPWLYAIVVRVVRRYRRTTRRKSPMHAPGVGIVDPDTLIDAGRPNPLEQAERGEAVRALYAVLDQMNVERREVFVLAELEQLTAPEIAHALSVNLNTVYWRLRTGRQEFEKILLRHQKTQPRSKR